MSRDVTRAEALGQQILLCCRNELYSLYPYLDGAFASLPGLPSGDTGSFGTDGEHLLFSPQYLVSVFSAAPQKVRRGYLHTLLHCLYLHPFSRGQIPPEIWDLACDMAVEQILEKEKNPRLTLPVSPVKAECLRILGTPRSAREIARWIEAGRFPFSLPAMAAAFLEDDHRLWDRIPPGNREKWEHVLSYTSQNRRSHSKRAGTRAGEETDTVRDPARGKYDYRRYLRRFAVPREEMELDMDSFDDIYYNLGMERYGNLPLIEPLEYREGHKLEELVIAIDTSGSCSRDTVAAFLGETYSILSRRENFFRKMKVYLIQCDCVIQSVAVIHSEEEWKNYSRDIVIQGRGGTDFTPVFRYVEEQQREGKLRDLRALLYFTDGDGCYPRTAPPYETAFVFLEEKKIENQEKVPPWAAILYSGEKV